MTAVWRADSASAAAAAPLHAWSLETRSCVPRLSPCMCDFWHDSSVCVCVSVLQATSEVVHYYGALWYQLQRGCAFCIACGVCV
jgi:hypothetical protein